MEEYARAAARVHAALGALQAAPENARARYADEFTQELVYPPSMLPPFKPAQVILFELVQRPERAQSSQSTPHAIYRDPY